MQFLVAQVCKLILNLSNSSNIFVENIHRSGHDLASSSVGKESVIVREKKLINSFSIEIWSFTIQFHARLLQPWNPARSSSHGCSTRPGEVIKLMISKFYLSKLYSSHPLANVLSVFVAQGISNSIPLSF